LNFIKTKSETSHDKLKCHLSGGINFNVVGNETLKPMLLKA